MSAKNTTKVLIDGKIITLSGYESEEYLQKVASYLNNKIAELSQIPGYKRQRPETKNTLLSLNVADDYFKAKNMAESLEEDIEVKDKENYDMKHDLIAAQIQLEKTNHEIEKLKKEKDELNGKVRELSDELEEFLKQ
ncbi:cell division protein ZapA [Blautia liquoris]|uniref:Cell division protein ZapA n=1 Tax=Blautia liquoris TaxID=2779518 RepID=A0A7M2RN28_9FIRM|nr:cell division protein ZapA [Blautia liquoris]QOV20772.1 cell division protein ZapA [Blautia liquoris]